MSSNFFIKSSSVQSNQKKKLVEIRKVNIFAS